MRHAGTTLSLALFLTATACGKVVPLTDGGGDDDDDPDAMVEPDASTDGAVTVHTFTRSGAAGPQSGISVVAINPDGTSDSVVTDGNGNGTLDVQGGATVVAIYPNGIGGAVIGGYAGVEGGDDLRFGEFIDETLPDPEVAQMTVTVPDADPNVPNNYQVYHSCGTANGSDSAPNMVIRQRESCDADPQDLIWVATADGNIVRQASTPGFDFINGGNGALQAWQPASTFSIDLTYPDGVSEAQAVIIAFRDNFDMFSISVGGVPVDNELTTTRGWAQGADRLLGQAFAFRPGFGGQVELLELPGTATSWTGDVATMPWLGEIVFNPSAGQAVWVTEGGDDGGDLTWLEINYRPNVTLGGSTDVTWHLLLPPDVDRFVLPDLPAEFDAFEPSETTQAGFVIAAIFDIGGVEGHDEARSAMPEWFLQEVLGVAGNTFRYTVTVND